MKTIRYRDSLHIPPPKIGADKLAESFHLSFELPVVTVRPLQYIWSAPISASCDSDNYFPVSQPKDGSLGEHFTHATRDLNFVANTVDGFVRAGSADAAIGKTINISSAEEVGIGD